MFYFILELSQSFSTCSLSQESRATSFHSFHRMPSNFEDELPTNSKSHKINFITAQLSSALDRTNVSARDATFILASAVESLGIPLENVYLSPSTVYRNRIKYRRNIGENIKKDFKALNILTVHWDGKLLPEMTGVTKVERLPVIITGLNCEQLLGVPKLNESSGLRQSEVIYDLLETWNITDKIGALCFDTCSVNTGIPFLKLDIFLLDQFYLNFFYSGEYRGVCKLLEKKIGKSLMNLACRHHIYELVLRSVFEIYWPTTAGPKVSIFNEFQQKWPQINKDNYKTGLDDKMVVSIIRDKKDDILLFISQQLQVSKIPYSFITIFL